LTFQKRLFPKQKPTFEYIPETRTALIRLQGHLCRHLTPYIAAYGGTSISEIERLLSDAIEETRVEEIVLECDSAGGSDLEYVKPLVDLIGQCEKPVIALVSPRAQSLCYYLICSCDQILLASPLCEVGSAGVVCYAAKSGESDLKIVSLRGDQKTEQLGEDIEGELSYHHRLLNAHHTTMMSDISFYRGQTRGRLRLKAPGPLLNQNDREIRPARCRDSEGPH